MSRWLGVKSKDIKIRLGEPEHQKSVEEALLQVNELTEVFKTSTKKPDPLLAILDDKIAKLDLQKSEATAKHRQERARLRDKQNTERKEEASRFRQSKSLLRHLWQWASGKRDHILKQRQAELEELENRFDRVKQELGHRQRLVMRKLRTKIAELKRQREAIEPQPVQNRERSQFTQSADPDFEFHKSQIKASPEYVLRLLSHKRKNIFTE